MSNEEKILQMLETMQGQIGEMNGRFDRVEARLGKIETRLDKVENSLDELKEHATITREACNTLVEWTEHASAVVQVPYPYKPE